jgi:uncharacterized protein
MQRRLAVLLLLALPAACASPNPDLYTLAALPGPTAHLPTRSIELRRIGLAAYLDRPEIVRSSAQYRLRVASNERWGEPLGGMLERVFTEDLVERLPGTAVFTEAGAISTAPDLVLELDIQRFDAEASGEIVLLAQVAMRHGDARQSADARTLRFVVRPTSAAIQDHVAAMSRALADLADNVSRQIGDFARPPSRASATGVRATRRQKSG